jgi:MFS transporter, DHA3 family, tetracycline resistance protein
VQYFRSMSSYRLYLAMSLTGVFVDTMYFTIATIYRVQVAHLNALQLVLVGTVMESAIFVFQVPTGVIADVFSRRSAIIIGIFIRGAAFVLEGSFPYFPAILVAQALWGLGYTFTAGAVEAWIAGEVGEERIGRTFLRGTQIGQLGALGGIALGVALASIRLNVPLVTAGVLTLSQGIALLLLMHERKDIQVTNTEQTSWQQMTGTIRSGIQLIRARPVLLTILGIGLFIGLYSEGYDRLNTAHFLKDVTLPPLGGFSYVVWFGIMQVGSILLSLGAVELAIRHIDMKSHLQVARTLLAMVSLLVLCLIGFGQSGSFALALLFFWLIAVLRDIIDPLYTSWLAQHTDPKIRATVISFGGQLDAFGQIVGGPPLGLLGLVRGIRTALVASGIVLSPACALLARTLWQRHEAITLESSAEETLAAP